MLRLLTISHLTPTIPTVSGHQVFLVVDTELRPLISLRRFLVVPVPRDQSVERNNLRRSERISSRAPSVDPNARGDKPMEQSAASSSESSGCVTPQTPGKWNPPASTDEVLLQARSQLKRNSEVYPRGDSPEPDDLNEYRPLDPSRGGSPTNEDDEIVTAGEGQAPNHRRKYQDASCVCTGVEGPGGVFTNTRSRSSSRAPEARNHGRGSEKKKATTTTTRDTRSSSRAPEAHSGNSKKAKDTEKSSKSSSASGAKAGDDAPRGKGLGAVPIFHNYTFCIDEFPDLICPRRHKMTIVTKAEMDRQDRKQRIRCAACLEPTYMSQAAYSCKKGCKLSNGDRLIICNRCNFDTAPSTGPVIACMLKDCANIKLPSTG